MKIVNEILVIDLGEGCGTWSVNQKYTIESYRGTSIIVSDEHLHLPSQDWPKGALIVHPVLFAQAFESPWAVDVVNPRFLPIYRGLADCWTRDEALHVARCTIDQGCNS